MYLSVKRFLLACVFLAFAVQAHAQNPWIFNGSGGSSSGGGVTLNVKNFGAQGNGAYVYDATSQASVVGQTTGTSTTPTAPSVTTVSANDTILTTLGTATGPLTAPGSNTSRQNVAFANNLNYGIYFGDQTKTTPGATGNISGSTSSSATWTGINIALTGHPSIVNSTTATSAGGATSSVAWPTGTSAGQEAIACISFGGGAGDNLSITGTGPTLFGSPLITSDGGANNNSELCYTHTVTGTESGNYAFTCAAGNCFSAAFIAVYGASSVDGANTITSATANWTQSNKGNLLCVPAGFVNGASTQQCGTISSVTNSTTIVPSFSVQNDSTPSEIGFAHNDTSAFTSAITAMQALTPCGGTLYIPAGGYGITPNSITMPTGCVINLLGAGASLHDYTEQATAFKSVPISGTTLMVLATSPSGPVIMYPPNTNGSDLWQWSTQESLSNLGIWCGAGTSRDGGGGDGIDIYWTHLNLDHFAVSNCSGDGVMMSNNNGVTSTFLGNLALEHFYLTFNNVGLRITGSGNSNQQISLYQGEVNQSTSFGIQMDTVLLAGFHADAMINQWNNQGASNPGYEWSITANCTGCTISDSWTEDEKANTNGFNMAPSFGQAPSLLNDYFDVTGSSSAGIKTTNVDGFELTNSWFSATTPFVAGSTVFLSNISNTNRLSTDGGNGAFSSVINGTSGTATCWANMTGGVVTFSCNLSGYANTGAAQTFSVTPFVAGGNLIYSDNCPSSHGSSASTSVLTLPTGSTTQTCVVTASSGGGVNIPLPTPTLAGNIIIDQGSASPYADVTMSGACTITAAGVITCTGGGGGLSTGFPTAAIVVGNGVNAVIYATAGPTGAPLLSQGKSGTPIYSPINLAGGGNIVVNTLPVGNGGVGNSSLVSNAILLGNGTNPVASVTPTLAGNMVLDQGSASPFADVAMGGDCTITGAGTITCTKTNGVAFGALATSGGWVWSGSQNGALATSTVPFSISGPLSAALGSEGNVQLTTSKKITLSNLNCVMTTASGGTASPSNGGWVVNIEQNKATATPLCVIPFNGTTCSDAVNTAVINVGDLVNLRAWPGGSPSATPTGPFFEVHCAVTVTG